LGEDDVVGEGGAQALDDEAVGGAVGFRHRLVAGLALDLERLAVVAAHQLGGLPRDAGRDVQGGSVVGHRAPLPARSRVSAGRPASSTSPASRGSAVVTRTGMARPMRSDANPMMDGEAASPSRWIAMVLIANPQPRRCAGRTFAMAALSGPVLRKSSVSATNIEGQKIAGDPASTPAMANGTDATSETPDSRKCPAGWRWASRSPRRPPMSVPTSPARASTPPNVMSADLSGR